MYLRLPFSFSLPSGRLCTLNLLSLPLISSYLFSRTSACFTIPRLLLSSEKSRPSKKALPGETVAYIKNNPPVVALRNLDANIIGPQRGVRKLCCSTLQQVKFTDSLWPRPFGLLPRLVAAEKVGGESERAREGGRVGRVNDAPLRIVSHPLA